MRLIDISQKLVIVKVMPKKSLQNDKKSRLFLIIGVVLAVAIFAVMKLVNANQQRAEINFVSSNMSNGRNSGAHGNECHYKKVQCVKAPCPEILVCDADGSIPPNEPQCFCPGTKALCPSGDVGLCPEPQPTATTIATPKPSTNPSNQGITSFKVAKPCGPTSYLSITYSCQLQASLVILADGVCTNFISALRTAQDNCGNRQEVK